MKINLFNTDDNEPSNNVHLSYCTNIHPGENWSALYPQLQQHLPKVKAAVSPGAGMGVGLRLSAIAAKELIENIHQLAQFKQWLDSQKLYVYTINGFPYGTFHAKAVKEKVYEPDWTTKERFAYTKNLAEILAYLLPAGINGSISTVPVGFKPNLNNESHRVQAVNHLLAFVEFASDLKSRTDKSICLALEPEPSCYLETMRDVTSFFSTYIYSDTFDTENKKKRETIKQHLGVCLDTCHSTVMFEEPDEFVKTMQDADIPVYKIQLTAALKIDCWQESYYDILKPYAEPTYLHQTCIKNPQTGEIRFYLDLDQALDAIQPEEELRSHFHVPVFAKELISISTTQEELGNFLHDFCQHPCSTHLEVETYTFDVLPDNLALGSISESISREITWVLDQLKTDFNETKNRF